MTDAYSIFLDSDAFVALVKKNDANHIVATELLQKLKERKAWLSTSNYVFAESITVISQKVDHETAISYIESIMSPAHPIEVIRATEEIDRLAIEIFKGQTSKNVSFVDCTNMAILDSAGFAAIFSFDAIYAKNGYSLAGDSINPYSNR